MLEGLTPPVRVLPCAVRSLREAFSESDLAIFDKALADPSAWPNRTLARALNERGVVITDGPIGRHRSGTCSCR